MMNVLKMAETVILKSFFNEFVTSDLVNAIFISRLLIFMQQL